MAEPRRNSRRQKIEPLNYTGAALAPALKGMTSFLDLSPEDVRNGNFDGLAVTLPPHGAPASGRIKDPFAHQEASNELSQGRSERSSAIRTGSCGQLAVVPIDGRAERYDEYVRPQGVKQPQRAICRTK
jgi:hypothetical protein